MIEPHPGSGRWTDISQPTTYDQRLNLARRTKSDLSATSLFLIDKMDNAVRADYGGLPNSAYIIGRDGLVFHKQPWMDSRTIRPPLEALLAAGGRGGSEPPQFTTGGTRPGGNRDRLERTRAKNPVTSYTDAPVRIPSDAKSEIVWANDLQKARALANQAGVPVLLEFHFDGCSYCAAMAKGPLRDKAVVNLSRKYVCVKIDMTTKSGEALAEEHEIVGTPAFVVFSPDGDVALKHVNYANADFIAGFLGEGLEMTARK